MARILDHVSVTVADLGRSLRFYQRLLKIPVLGSGEDEGPPVSHGGRVISSRFRYADLSLGEGQILELLQYLKPRRRPVRSTPYAPGGGHIGLRVANLGATMRRLRKARVVPRFDPVQFDSPPWWAGTRVVYVSDPDGTTVELVERRTPPPSPVLRRRASANKRRNLGRPTAR